MNNYYDFHVLVVDDNPAIHDDFNKILTNPSTSSALEELDTTIFGASKIRKLLPKFQIDAVSRGEDAVIQIESALKQGKRYALAFVDIRMPSGLNGIESIKQIWKIDKDIQIVICTAYSDYSWEETIAELGQSDSLIILKKPFDYMVIRQLACALTRKWQLTQETAQYTSTLEHQIEEKTSSLQQSLSLAQATMDSSNDGILVIDSNGKVVSFNNKFLSMWGMKKALLIKSDFSVILNKISLESLDPTKFMKKSKEINEHSESIHIDVVRLKDGRTFEYYSQPQKLENKPVGRVWSFRDITQRTTLEEKLQHEVTHDPLTGLPNRALLNNRLKQAAAISELNNTVFAILFLDLDHFKLINDTLGYSVGDEILCSVANRLVGSIRSCDTLIRMGSDEFIIILTEFANQDYVKEVAQKILDIISKPTNTNEHEIIVTASIGISIYPKDNKNTETLLKHAGAANNYAKQAGGNQLKFYNKKMNEEITKLFEHENHLRRAIINNEFFLCYQPQIDMKTDKLIAVEALIRWNHPQQGVVLPNDFISLAEASGLIIPIGEWILRTACKQVKAWQDAGLPPIRVAVNVTANQLGRYDFIKTVVGILEQTGLKPEFLEIEFTENMVMNNPQAIRAINALREVGVRTALDDFGTGYSSLNYLRKMTIDRLKIDSSFIQNIHINPGDEAIIRSIIDIANNLNLEVLAEGVETKAQVDFLKSNKIGQIQGFYFSHALTASELESILNDKNKMNKIRSLLEK